MLERGIMVDAVNRDLNRLSGRNFLAARVGVQMAGDSSRGRAEDDGRGAQAAEQRRGLDHCQEATGGGTVKVCVAAIAEADCVRRGGHAQRSRGKTYRKVVIAVERGGLAGAVECDLDRFASGP